MILQILVAGPAAAVIPSILLSAEKNLQEIRVYPEKNTRPKNGSKLIIVVKRKPVKLRVNLE